MLMMKNFVYRGGVCTKCLKSGKIKKLFKEQENGKYKIGY